MGLKIRAVPAMCTNDIGSVLSYHATENSRFGRHPARTRQRCCKRRSGCILTRLGEDHVRADFRA